MKQTLWLFLMLLCASMIQAQIEPNAGTWKTWFITSGKSHRLPPPPKTAESKRIVVLQEGLGSAGWQQILYWNTGAPSYRWREMMIALAEKDTSRPRPYVGMLLNVAVYDATVAAWDSKYAYKRPRPFVQHAAVRALIPKPESPSYPCEHSVAAGVTVALVSHLYPQKIDSVLQLAQRAMQSRVAAGVAYSDDTKAGFELGQQVAAVIIEKTKACAPTAAWDGKIPGEPGMWKGKNPVGPTVGSWKPVVLASGNQLRPGPPPNYQKEMDDLRNFKPTFRSTANAFFFAS